MWWKIRWASSQYGNEADRTMISYKESLDSAPADPADPPTWTGAWGDPRFSPPADGGQPENALTGQLWKVNCGSYADPGAIASIRQASLLAKYERGQPAVRPDILPRRTTKRWDMSGMRTSTTGSGRPARSTCPRHARMSRRLC